MIEAGNFMAGEDSQDIVDLGDEKGLSLTNLDIYIKVSLKDINGSEIFASKNQPSIVHGCGLSISDLTCTSAC